jgi:hypothetical protein
VHGGIGNNNAVSGSRVSALFTHSSLSILHSGNWSFSHSIPRSVTSALPFLGAILGDLAVFG